MINNLKLQDLSCVKNTFIYMVEKGDTLKSIADKFHTTMQVLIVINGLESEVKAGEYIVVEKIDGELYYVKPGDTLEKIAKNDSEKIKNIKRRNKIDKIYPGQKIYIV